MIDFFKNLFKFSTNPHELIFRSVVIFGLKILAVVLLILLGIWIFF